jgi:hypothetical protein
MTSPPLTSSTPSVTLTVWFDADQISSQLDYSLKRGDNGGTDPEPRQGKHAGAAYFTQGEKVRLHVVGSGSKNNFKSFKIVQCCIITRPQITQCGDGTPTLFAAPSPFLP